MYANNKIFTFESNLKSLQGKFIWKLINSKLPDSINDIFINHGAILSDRKRDEMTYKMRLPFQRTNLGLDFIIYSGIKLWNQVLTIEIKQAKKLSDFKSKIKTFLLIEQNK